MPSRSPSRPPPLNLDTLSLPPVSSSYAYSPGPSPRHRPTPSPRPGPGPKSPSSYLAIPIASSLPTTPFTPGFPIAKSEIRHASPLLLMLLGINVLSMAYTWLVTRAATDRRSELYEWMHRDDTTWEGMWWSCRTFAALVSLTNVFLLLVTVGKLTRNVVWGNLAFDGKSLLSRIALAFSALGILGILVLLGLVPWRLTWGWQGTREDLHYVYGFNH